MPWLGPGARSGVLEEHPLDPAAHDRSGFDSGVPELDEYLRRYADQHRRRGISAVYVLTDSSAPEVILGYYSLSAAEVDAPQLSEADRRRLPRYPVPCFRMGRLACRIDQRGRGLGRLLVGCAVERCLKARIQVAAYALIVDAKDDLAKAFYEHYGFTPFAGRPSTLYLPLGPGRSKG
ncbi:MAG: GNAT family N-acetyltransferase [Burkholderiales bacterium]|nr:GNAT family N-acetyltransferase [Burkholderiales bacterium]